ncbi:MAG: outer membrane protein transport protein [Deltaproteobacteria bacterium]|nr:outer membrane protein transport protein [Deltaproteobacteria bacterium]
MRRAGFSSENRADAETGPFVFARIAAAAAFLFVAADAGAQEVYTYALGERASAMGGAYIALADDASGCYYNPAGIAFAESLRFSVTGNVYGYSHIKYKNAFQVGDLSGDLESEMYYAHPQSFGTVYRFDALKFEDPLPQRQAFGFSIMVPDRYVFRDLASYRGERHQLSISEDVQTYWFGPSYAYRLRSRLSAGATLYGLFGQENVRSNWQGEFTDEDLSFLDGRMDIGSYYEENRTTFGILLLGGLLYAPQPWRLGLVARTPSTQLFGKGDATNNSFLGYQTSHASDQDYVKFEPKREDPWLVGGGLAYERPQQFTLSADALYTGGLSYDDADKEEAASRVKLNPVTNVRAGAEYYVSPVVPLRAGFFTNFAKEDPDNEDSGPVLDLYGVTAGAGVQHRQFTMAFAVNYVFGSGHAWVTALREKRRHRRRRRRTHRRRRGNH